MTQSNGGFSQLQRDVVELVHSRGLGLTFG